MARPAPIKFNRKGTVPGNLVPGNAKTMKAAGSEGGAGETAPAEEKARVEGSEASTAKPPEQKIAHEKLPTSWTGGGGWSYRKVEGGIVATNPKTGANVRVDYGSKDYNDIIDEVARGDVKPGQATPPAARVVGGDEAAPADFTVESGEAAPSKWDDVVSAFANLPAKGEAAADDAPLPPEQGGPIPRAWYQDLADSAADPTGVQRQGRLLRNATAAASRAVGDVVRETPLVKLFEGDVAGAALRTAAPVLQTRPIPGGDSFATMLESLFAGESAE